MLNLLKIYTAIIKTILQCYLCPIPSVFPIPRTSGGTKKILIEKLFWTVRTRYSLEIIFQASDNAMVSFMLKGKASLLEITDNYTNTINCWLTETSKYKRIRLIHSKLTNWNALIMLFFCLAKYRTLRSSYAPEYFNVKVISKYIFYI